MIVCAVRRVNSAFLEGGHPATLTELKISYSHKDLRTQKIDTSRDNKQEGPLQKNTFER